MSIFSWFYIILCCSCDKNFSSSFVYVYCISKYTLQLLKEKKSTCLLTNPAYICFFQSLKLPMHSKLILIQGINLWHLIADHKHIVHQIELFLLTNWTGVFNLQKPTHQAPDICDISLWTGIKRSGLKNRPLFYFQTCYWYETLTANIHS